MGLAERINQVLNLGGEHTYYSRTGTWYNHLRRFPATLIDAEGYVYFATEASYQSNDGIQLGAKVNIPNGIANLPGYRIFTENERFRAGMHAISPPEPVEVPIDEKALRKKREVDALVRNQRHVDAIKKLYQNTCQLCGLRMQIRPNKYYSEVHHIKPLGQQHNGPDVKANMLCVCPNHHAMLDFFALRLNLNLLCLIKHSIAEAYVAYHNQRVDSAAN